MPLNVFDILLYLFNIYVYVPRLYYLSALVGYWFSVSIMRIILKLINVCPFDYTAVALSWKFRYPFTGFTTPVGWLLLHQLTVLVGPQTLCNRSFFVSGIFVLSIVCWICLLSLVLSCILTAIVVLWLPRKEWQFKWTALAVHEICHYFRGNYKTIIAVKMRFNTYIYIYSQPISQRYCVK